MIELLLLVPTAVLGFLLWRADRRFDGAYAEWTRERGELLTRIQAPQLAPTLSAAEPSEEPLYVGLDDQAAHDRLIEGA